FFAGGVELLAQRIERALLRRSGFGARHRHGLFVRALPGLERFGVFGTERVSGFLESLFVPALGLAQGSGMSRVCSGERLLFFRDGSRELLVVGTLEFADLRLVRGIERRERFLSLASCGGELLVSLLLERGDLLVTLLGEALDVG